MSGHELYRPRFHLTPEAMWMNDPNGFFFDGTRYHLYYQHNPQDKVWGPMHWGHAESLDLMHWTHRGIVMAPDALGAIFSGSAVSVPPGAIPLLPQGGVAYLFTHHDDQGVERQSLATSTDGGQTLAKYPGNPVIENDGLPDFRDPKVFWYAPLNAWCMVVAGGPVRIYHSRDLINWTLTQQMDEIQTECPDLFPLPWKGRELWVLSACGVQYYLGEFDGLCYHVLEGPLKVDSGDSFYAAQSCAHAPGRLLWIGWMNGSSTGPTDPWRCSMSLPRELTLEDTPEGPRLHQAPARELDGLRGAAVASSLSAGGQACLPVDSHILDAVIDFPASAEPPQAGLELFATGQGACRISYDGRAVCVDRSGVMDSDGRQKVQPRLSFPLPWRESGLQLRVVADQSTLEVFGPGGCVITCEVYGGSGEHLPVRWALQAGAAHLTVYELPMT